MKALVRRINRLFASLILLVFYFVVLGPVSLIARIIRKSDTPTTDNTYWQTADRETDYHSAY